MWFGGTHKRLLCSRREIDGISRIRCVVENLIGSWSFHVDCTQDREKQFTHAFFLAECSQINCENVNYAN